MTGVLTFFRRALREPSCVRWYSEVLGFAERRRVQVNGMAKAMLIRDDVLITLRTRPKDVHVVLTGRRCPPELIELADTVTEMTLIKHAFKAGVPAQRGIED